MYDLAILRERVRRQRGSFQELAKVSGMSASWLSKFACGRYASPRLVTVERLASALDEIEGKEAA